MTTDGSRATPGQPASEPGQPPRGTRAGMKAHDRPVVGRRAERAIQVSNEKYSGTAADGLRRRLDALDFMNQAMVLAGTPALLRPGPGQFSWFLLIDAAPEAAICEGGRAVRMRLAWRCG